MFLLQLFILFIALTTANTTPEGIICPDSCSSYCLVDGICEGECKEGYSGY